MSFLVNFLKASVYLALTAGFYYGASFDAGLNREFPFDRSFGGKAKFLTCLNLFLETFYFGLCTLNAVTLCFFGKSATMKKIFDFLYSSIVFPLGATVSFVFWGLYLIDRKLIFPKSAEAFIPPFANHMMHTLPLVGVLIDNILTHHSYPKFVNGVKYTILIGATYLIWVFYIAYATGGKWVYPVLAVLDNNFRVLFCLGQLLIVSFFYKVGELLTNEVFWRNHEVNKSKKKAKKTH